MDYYVRALQKYFDFKGRDTRRQYWMFFLVNFLIAVAIAVVVTLASNEDISNKVSNIYAIAVFLPGLGAAVRRLHDAGHSGFWIILPIVNLVLMCLKTEEKENRWGPIPVDNAEA